MASIYYIEVKDNLAGNSSFYKISDELLRNELLELNDVKIREQEEIEIIEAAQDAQIFLKKIDKSFNIELMKIKASDIVDMLDLYLGNKYSEELESLLALQRTHWLSVIYLLYKKAVGLDFIRNFLDESSNATRSKMLIEKLSSDNEDYIDVFGGFKEFLSYKVLDINDTERNNFFGKDQDKSKKEIYKLYDAYKDYDDCALAFPNYYIYELAFSRPNFWKNISLHYNWYGVKNSINEKVNTWPSNIKFKLFKKTGTGGYNDYYRRGGNYNGKPFLNGASIPIPDPDFFEKNNRRRFSFKKYLNFSFGDGYISNCFDKFKKEYFLKDDNNYLDFSELHDDAEAFMFSEDYNKPLHSFRSITKEENEKYSLRPFENTSYSEETVLEGYRMKTKGILINFIQQYSKPELNLTRNYYGSNAIEDEFEFHTFTKDEVLNNICGFDAFCHNYVVDDNISNILKNCANYHNLDYENVKNEKEEVAKLASDIDLLKYPERMDFYNRLNSKLWLLNANDTEISDQLKSLIEHPVILSGISQNRKEEEALIDILNIIENMNEQFGTEIDTKSFSKLFRSMIRINEDNIGKSKALNSNKIECTLEDLCREINLGNTDYQFTKSKFFNKELDTQTQITNYKNMLEEILAAYLSYNHSKYLGEYVESQVIKDLFIDYIEYLSSDRNGLIYETYDNNILLSNSTLKAYRFSRVFYHVYTGSKDFCDNIYENLKETYDRLSFINEFAYGNKKKTIKEMDGAW